MVFEKVFTLNMYKLNDIESSISNELSDGQLNLKLTGKNNIRGTGNNLDNQIIGNKGKNILKVDRVTTLL